MQDGDRFVVLKRFLDERFGERSKEVGLIFVFTPEEFADYDEDRRTS